MDDNTPAVGSPDYLERRERAERAVAKQSTTLAARRAHQELAQLIYAARNQLGKPE